MLRAFSEFGITVHWIILQYSIGIWTIAVTLEILARVKKQENYLKMARSLSKVAILIFAVGAATGTMAEFGLLLFWPGFLELVGIFFFAPLYIEVFAFFAEVIFVYLYHYTWKKVGPKFHIFLGIMAVGGLILSGLMIVSANTLMSFPPGIQETYDPITGEYQSPSFIYTAPNGTEIPLNSTQIQDMIENDPDQYNELLEATVMKEGVIGIVFKTPGAVTSFMHAIVAAILTSIFTLIGVYAHRLKKVKEEKKEYYRDGIKFLVILGIIYSTIQGIIGHFMADEVARFNPEKLAAMEGTCTVCGIITISDIPILGPITEATVKFLAYGSIDAFFPSYMDIPEEYRPPLIIHYIYYTKIGMMMSLFASLLLIAYFMFYKKQDTPEWVRKGMLGYPLSIQLVSIFGWMTREIGRKPWTIFGVLSVEDAARDGPVSTGIIILLTIYILVISFGLWFIVWFLNRLSSDELLDEIEEEDRKAEDKKEEINKVDNTIKEDVS